MIEIQQLKKGLLVWWKAERTSRSWSYPAVVTLAAKDHFKVMGFDDFKESDELHISRDLTKGDDCRQEMTQCSFGDVVNYLKDRETTLEDVVIKKGRELTTAKNNLQSFKKKSKAWAKKYVANLK
ncbi:MAG: hypothetical protein ABSE68_02170 [Minisyncoccia bacterium]